MTQLDWPQHYRTAMACVFRLGTVYDVMIGTGRGEHLDENVRLVEELAPQYPPRAIG